MACFLLHHVNFFKEVHVLFLEVALIVLLINLGLVFDLFGSLSKFEGRKSFFDCHLVGVQGADDHGLRVSTQRVFKEVGELGLSIVYVARGFLRLSFRQKVDDAAQE